MISSFLRSPELELSRSNPTPVFSGDPAAIERGSALFATNCATCHGAGGKGDGPTAASLDPKPIDFTNPIHRGHSDDYLVSWISNGLPGSAMPAFAGTLSAAEIDDVVTFIRSLQASVAAEANLDIPDPAGCQIDPVQLESLMPDGTIVPRPVPTRAPRLGPESYPWPRGEPASQDEIDGITRTIREFYACANAGDYPRRLALYTGRVVEAQFNALDAAGWQATLEFAATPSTAVPAGDRGWIESIREVRRLADGRVGAYVAAVDPVNHPHQINAVVVFARDGDRWLIDEVHDDPTGNMGLPTTPESSDGVPVARLGTPITSSGLIVTLIKAPASYGFGIFEVEIKQANGQRVDNAEVEFAVEMPGMEMGIQEVTAEADDEGIYRAEIAIGMPGLWRLDVTIRQDGAEPVRFAFDFAIG